MHVRHQNETYLGAMTPRHNGSRRSGAVALLVHCWCAGTSGLRPGFKFAAHAPLGHRCHSAFPNAHRSGAGAEFDTAHGFLE
jgi:hypothetical protein